MFKIQIFKAKILVWLGVIVLDFGNLNFVFVSSLDIRISNLFYWLV